MDPPDHCTIKVPVISLHRSRSVPYNRIRMSINEALANSIARIVDDRVRSSFAERDSVLTQMHESLQDVATLLKQRTLNMQTLQNKMMNSSNRSNSFNANHHRLVAPSAAANQLGFKTAGHENTHKHTTPSRPRGNATTPGYFSPRKAKTHRAGIVISSKTRSGKNRIGYASKTHGGGGSGFILEQQSAKTNALISLNDTSSTTAWSKRDDKGTLVIPTPNELPRVARKKFHDSHGWTSPRDRHDHNTKEYIQKKTKITISDTHRLKHTEASKTAIFRPTTWRPSKKDKLPPGKGLVLEWVYGYGRSINLASHVSNANAIYHLKTSELVWAVAGVCVMFDENRMTQRFFVGHDGEVSCLAVHPNGLLVASGQMSRSNAKICIWSAGSHASFENVNRSRNNLQSSSYDPSDSKYPRYAPEICKPLQLPIGNGVAALDFSPDGKYILSIAMNMHHTMTLWDWKKRIPLSSVKSHSAPVYFCRFNPYQHYVDGGGENQVNEDECKKYSVYTAVTGGLNHLKVWTLRFENIDENENDQEDWDENGEIITKVSNANRGNANTGFLSKNDHQLFASFRDTKKNETSTNHPTQWRHSFKPKETDQKGVDRVGYNARQKKGMTLEESAHNNNNRENRNNAGSEDRYTNRNNDRWCWTISGHSVKTKKNKNVPTNKLPGRDTTYCLCFLPNGLGTGGACITGSNQGHLTFWHQQVEQGAAKLIPRATSRRGIMDRIITGWDPVGWQGVTLPNGHDGHAITCIAAMAEQTPDQQLRFLTGGRDLRIIIWDIPTDRVTSTKPKQMLALRVDSCPIGILLNYNKALVSTVLNGLLELDISNETKQLKPNVLFHGHTKSVNCIDTYPQHNVPIFCTVGNDAVVRMWSLRERRQLTEAVLPSAGISCAFSKNGELLVVGTANGGVLIYGVRSNYPPGLDLRYQDVPSKLAQKEIVQQGGDAAGGWPAPNPQNTKTIATSPTSPLSKSPQQPTRFDSGSSSLIVRLPHAMTAVRFSPNGLHLVAASRDHHLYLYKEHEDPNALPGSFCQIGVFKGHWSAVTQVDWSSDSSTIMSNGADREILYWNPTTMKQDCATMAKRDMKWDTWTCVLGWPMQGAWNNKTGTGLVHDGIDKSARLFMDGNLRKNSHWLNQIRAGQHGFGSNGGEANYFQHNNSNGNKGIGASKQKRLAVDTMNLLGVARSNGGKLLATGDVQHQVSMFRYPAVQGAKSKRYRGHGSMVKCVRFAQDDQFLLSAGGLDNSIFLWNVTSMDNDPSLLTLNFAHSHLESFRFQSQPHASNPPSSSSVGPSRLLRGVGEPRDRKLVLEEDRRANENAWKYLEGKSSVPPSSTNITTGRSMLPEESLVKTTTLEEVDEEKEKMWEYLDEAIEVPTDGTALLNNPLLYHSSSSPSASSSVLALVEKGQEEINKWDFLNNDSTQMSTLPVFDSLKKKPFRLGKPTSQNAKVKEINIEKEKSQSVLDNVENGNDLKDFAQAEDEVEEEREEEKEEEKEEVNVPHLFTCFGLFDFESSGDGEIKSFEKEDEIYVTSIEEEDGWWRGRKNKKELGSWGLLFPKNRVYTVIEYENKQYMLTTDDEPDIFTMSRTGEWDPKEENIVQGSSKDGEEPIFVGHWEASTKTLITVHEDETIPSERLDWSSSYLVGCPGHATIQSEEK